LPPQFEIGQPAYGELFHSTAAEFYSTHGEAFCARQGRLPSWIRHAHAIAGHRFDGFAKKYALASEAARAQQLDRLVCDLRDLLELDWGGPAPSRVAALERPFGRTVPVALDNDGITLYVNGRIDRVDVVGPMAIVRDLKTGRSHRRIGKEADPQPTLDIQIAIYGLVALLLAEVWNLPKRIGAEYIYVGRGAVLRSFRDDFHERLEPAARRWLSIAGRLLSQRAFPLTPVADDCGRCAFNPFCGTEEQAETIAGDGAALEEYAALRTGQLEHQEE
jgi:hypothetical protein